MALHSRLCSQRETVSICFHGKLYFSELKEKEMEKSITATARDVQLRADLRQPPIMSGIGLSELSENRGNAAKVNDDREAWIKENTEAMREANRFISENGLWSDDLRFF